MKRRSSILTAICLAIGVMAGNDSFSIATLNVDGLPRKILFILSNPDGPGEEGTRLASQYLASKGYDLIGVQEDFNYDGELRFALEDGYDYDEWQGGISMGGVNWLTIWRTKFKTDGLRMFWKKGHQLEHEETASWTESYGKIDHCWDDMVTKGFRRSEIKLATGQQIVVYNMHMDASTESDEAAGRDTGDKEARWSQWRQLRDSVINRLDHRPVILLGDMNSLYPRDSIEAIFINAINATGHHQAHDTWVEVCMQGHYPTFGNPDRNAAYANGEVLDKILYINPIHGQRLELKDYRLEQDYTWDDGTPMGDHYPVSAIFEFTDEGSSGISQSETLQPVAEAWFSPDGRRLTRPSHGLNIIRMSNGKTRKVMIP